MTPRGPETHLFAGSKAASNFIWQGGGGGHPTPPQKPPPPSKGTRLLVTGWGGMGPNPLTAKIENGR